ncbi:16S rRNA (guanine(527)-N(7))-methyltransferase RsmG [Sphingomonas sp.]|uniref:16S rRNA (guanine(527)-N(7))-methyltransferase RsmG n=1 Tax=Sphingomonas sp. TaxID=28214 RepID=UPI0035C7FF4E
MSAREQAAAIAGAALPRLDRYVELLLEENQRQNLISRGSEADVWSRHILDSLQLATFARPGDSTWVDIGSGPGLPGLVLATLDRWQMVLVEPRPLRTAFLMRVIEALGLSNVEVHTAKAQQVSARADLITARAVASLTDLFAMTRQMAHRETRYVLPKGRTATADVDLAKRTWQGLFHVEQSLTDPDAGIVVADRIRAR